MEGTIPPRESHVWFLNDFIERRKNWDQRDETRLAEYLQHLSNKINQGAKNTLNELNELVASVDDAVVKVANINNEFQLLADKQFIENKVQEEDETVHTSIKELVVPKINDADSVVNHLKEILKNSFKAVDTHFDRVTVIVSDSDDDDDESKHEETVLRPRTFYKKLNLPLLSGNTEPEIVLDCTMSSETDSEVEEHINTYKYKESSSINDIPTENIHSTNESKIIHVTHNNMFGTEQLDPTNGPLNVDNAEDNLFSPPPLHNENDDDDLDYEYNIFGNSNSNNFWDENDDDEDLSDQPPLPIHFDEPPQQFVKPQEKIEAPSIQQSLNDELQKRFRKDNISLPSDNVNTESSKTKLPKGAVNILGGTDTKPYIPIPAQNIKQIIPPDMKKPVINTKHNSSVDDTEYNISDKLLDNSSQSPLISARNKNASKETKPVKKRSFFEQDSDDDNLFSEKTTRVPVPASEIPIQNNNLGESAKLSKTMFLESDSDEDFLSSKSNNNKLSSHPTVDENTNKCLDSSSDDDLFSNKSVLKEKSIMVSSKIQDKEFTGKDKTNNEIKENFKSSVEEINLMNKEVINELKTKSVNLSVSVNTSVIKEDSSPTKNIFNSSNTKSSSVDGRVQQSDRKSSSSQHTKSFSNLFSSDEDDFNDDKFSFNNVSIKNCVKKDESVSTNSVKNVSSEHCASKMDIFDSSSDDEIFNVIKVCKNVDGSKIIQKSVSNEIKNIEPTPNNDLVVFNQVQITEKVAEIDTKIESNHIITNVFRVLSNDEDDDLSVNNISNKSTNSSNSQKINDSFSTEDFLSLPSDSINKDIKKSLPRDVSDFKSETFNANKTLSNKSFIFLSDDDDEQISIKSEEETNSTVNKISENFLDSEKQGLLKNKETNTSNHEATNNSIENCTQSNKLSLFLCGDNEQQVSCDPMIQNENSKNYQNIVTRKISDSSSKEIILEKSHSHKDSIDGLSFSRSNSSDETPKKLPGKLSKNAGAFINVKGLLPNFKNSSKPLNASPSDLLNENNDDNLPTSGSKLFSVEKERVKIQVKRRPPSRKARQATRASYVDVGHESNLQQCSRLFGSTSDLVDYQSSPVLKNNVTDSLGKAQNEIQVPSSNILLVTDDKIDEKFKTKKNILNLFDDDSDPFELSHGEKDPTDIKKKMLDEKEPEFKVVHTKLQEIESIDNLQPFIEPAINKLETKSVYKILPNVEPVKGNDIVKTINQEKIESKSTTQNTVPPEKSNSLFGDEDLFPPKSEKPKVSSSNIFDSDEDDEVEFDRKFTKISLAKSKSIFDDDSDEDLFSTPSKPSASNLSSQKPIGTKSNQQNRPISDGYVKLAAESVAINPLESKKD